MRIATPVCALVRNDGGGRRLVPFRRGCGGYPRSYCGTVNARSLHCFAPAGRAALPTPTTPDHCPLLLFYIVGIRGTARRPFPTDSIGDFRKLKRTGGGNAARPTGKTNVGNGYDRSAVSSPIYGHFPANSYCIPSSPDLSAQGKCILLFAAQIAGLPPALRATPLINAGGKTSGILSALTVGNAVPGVPAVRCAFTPQGVRHCPRRPPRTIARSFYFTLLASEERHGGRSLRILLEIFEN